MKAKNWVNPGEIAGDAIDDDGNGEIDDVQSLDARGKPGNPCDGVVKARPAKR